MASVSYNPSNNFKLRFELKPNYTIKFDGYNVRLPKITTISINSDGFRDKEYPLEKSKNTFRIIILGDSVTSGFGVENNESYPEILEAKLNALNNGINYEVLNFGVWGYGTTVRLLIAVVDKAFPHQLLLAGLHLSSGSPASPEPYKCPSSPTPRGSHLWRAQASSLSRISYIQHI